MQLSFPGQMLNVDKSSLFLSPNVSDTLAREISIMLIISPTLDPGTYLGLPSIWGRSKTAALNYIVDRIQKKVQGWKSKFLNLAGKEVLIKAVALAMPMYPMSCFKFPSTTCKQINGVLSKFWWSNGDSNAHSHWKRWECWCIWNNPDAFWVHVLKAKYFPDGDFLKARRGPCPSWAWASLLEGRKIMSDGAIWQIGNGLKVKIWRDNWLHHKSILRPKPTIIVSGPIPTLVNDLTDRDLREWNLAGISNVIDPTVAKLIRAIPLRNLTRKDTLIWPWNKDGLFSVQSGYHWAMENLEVVCSVPEHHSHQVEKKLWKIRANPVCSLCNSSDESAEHAILLCPWTACVWFGIPLNYSVNAQSVTSFDRWLLGVTASLALLEGRNKEVLVLVAPPVLILLLDSLWGELCPTLEAITCPTPSASPPHALWKAPPQPYVKVNVDGAWHKNSLQGGVGCCLHDSEGRLLAGLSQACIGNSAIEVEAEAVLEGLLLAKEENCQKIILESDSMDVISCMRNENLRGNWRIIPFILEIRRLSSWFISIKWEWISRQANQAAHAASALSNMRVRSMH
ncbi:unnamed protein product [Prunus armeniaca]